MLIGYYTDYDDVIPLYIRISIENAIAKYSENSKNMILLVHPGCILKHMNQN